MEGGKPSLKTSKSENLKGVLAKGEISVVEGCNGIQIAMGGVSMAMGRNSYIQTTQYSHFQNLDGRVSRPLKVP